MLNLIFFDSDHWSNLWPMTLTRPSAEVKCGALSVSDKWALALGGKRSYLTQPYLSAKFPITVAADNLLINGTWLPDAESIAAVSGLKLGQSLKCGEVLLAARLSGTQYLNAGIMSITKSSEYGEPRLLESLESIISYNSKEIVNDIKLLVVNQKISSSDENDLLFIHKDAKTTNAIFNTRFGPIYIDEEASILENSVIYGPCYIGRGATVKVGTQIYSGTAIGPNCKIAGEVKNTNFYSNSNKGHYGYVGDSVIGEWCNMGAGTTTSNMKNTYGHVNLYRIAKKNMEKTSLQFCGTIMGDHCKTAIGTLLNTGTVIGVNSNVLDQKTPKYIPSFTWRGDTAFDIKKAKIIASKAMSRRGVDFSEHDSAIFDEIYKITR